MWGTTSLQLSLVDAESGAIVETRTGRGVSRLDETTVEAELFRLCETWIEQYDVSDVVLGGMVGSSLGWWEVPYIECPTSVSEIAANVSSRKIKGISVHISPGLKCENFLGEPDVMRGEEVELMAWLKTHPAINEGRSLICIPGTHTKWIEVSGDQVGRFQTSIVGEVFDVLTANGVLVEDQLISDAGSENAFLGGVDSIVKAPGALLQLLMSVRARALLAGSTPVDAAERLSGLLIGADVVNALSITGFQEGKDILPVIGNENLASRYAKALRHVGVTPLPLNALNIGAAGLHELACQLRARA
jgi:2-dehydro-3-deoxygalactonokinase